MTAQAARRKYQAFTMADETIGASWLASTCCCRKYQAFTMADETLRGIGGELDYNVANTKPLRWLMKPRRRTLVDPRPAVANTKPLRWLMKPTIAPSRRQSDPRRKYQAFTMADETLRDIRAG